MLYPVILFVKRHLPVTFYLFIMPDSPLFFSKPGTHWQEEQKMLNIFFSPQNVKKV